MCYLLSLSYCTFECVHVFVVCVFVSGHYIHVCVRMLTVRPCVPACQNGGTCNTGTCACTSGFTGGDCSGKDSVCVCVYMCMCVYVYACVCVHVDTFVCVSQFLQHVCIPVTRCHGDFLCIFTPLSVCAVSVRDLSLNTQF